MVVERHDNQIETNINQHRAYIVRTSEYNNAGQKVNPATKENQDELKNVLETSQQDLLEAVLEQLKILNMHMSFITEQNIREVNDD